ncbi:hypothetical protein Drorol1_Dr00012247, partial [Drosera rotundifolia]
MMKNSSSNSSRADLGMFDFNEGEIPDDAYFLTLEEAGAEESKVEAELVVTNFVAVVELTIRRWCWFCWL